MKVTIESPHTRRLTLEATIDELLELVAATRTRKRTKAQNRALHELGEHIAAAAPDLFETPAE